MLDSLFTESDLAQVYDDNRPLIIDSFAGGGGASSGIAQALGVEPDFAINHDELALSMHAANHPNTTHLITSVNAVDPRDLARRGQRVGLLWASPDCVHFSRARGARPKDNNIRGLAWVVVHWVEVLSDQAPEVILLENVPEFKTWEDFEPWKAKLKKHGYRMEFRELKACDYGAPTIRNRLFMVARRDGRPIVWPKPTHGDPKSRAVKSGKILPWRTAGSIIDWSVPMPSIFDDSQTIMDLYGVRAQRPLKDNTLSRIAKGLQRFIIDAENPYIVKDEAAFISHAQQGGRSRSAHEPMHTICASRKDQNQVVTAKLEAISAFMAQHNSGMVGRDLSEPLSTLTSRGTQQQIVAAHMVNMRGSDGRGARSLHDPLATVTSQGNHAALVAAFMVKYFGTAVGASLNDPLHTVTTKDRFALVAVNIGGEKYAITDIRMRLLTPREQFLAQGFEPDYQIDRGHDGRTLTKSQQNHKCGNSVSPNVAKALVAANCQHIKGQLQ